MTISSDSELEQAHYALALLRKGIASLRRDVPNRRTYAVMAEGPESEIKRIESEIDAYLRGLATGPTIDVSIKWPSAIAVPASSAVGPRSGNEYVPESRAA